MWLPPGIELYEMALALIGLITGFGLYGYYTDEKELWTEPVRSGAPPEIDWSRWQETNVELQKYKRLAHDNKRSADAYMLEVEGLKAHNKRLNEKLHRSMIETNRRVLAAGPVEEFMRTKAEIVAQKWAQEDQ